MSDTESANPEKKAKDPNAPPWYKLKKHPLIYILFVANWIEFSMWWGCMCSCEWKVGPFTDFQGASDYFEAIAYFGPWFTCKKEFEYDAYSVWTDPYLDTEERFSAKTSFWGSIKYKSGGGATKKKFEAMVGFGGGILIGAIVSSILWLLWIVFDIMEAMIKNMILPIIKMVQCFCAMIMLICLELLSSSGDKMWGYYFAVGLMFFQALLIVGHWLLACCSERLDWMLCGCCPCCICCPEPEKPPPETPPEE